MGHVFLPRTVSEDDGDRSPREFVHDGADDAEVVLAFGPEPVREGFAFGIEVRRQRRGHEQRTPQMRVAALETRPPSGVSGLVVAGDESEVGGQLFFAKYRERSSGSSLAATAQADLGPMRGDREEVAVPLRVERRGFEFPPGRFEQGDLGVQRVELSPDGLRDEVALTGLALLLLQVGAGPRQVVDVGERSREALARFRPRLERDWTIATQRATTRASTRSVLAKNPRPPASCLTRRGL